MRLGWQLMTPRRLDIISISVVLKFPPLATKIIYFPHKHPVLYQPECTQTQIYGLWLHLNIVSLSAAVSIISPSHFKLADLTAEAHRGVYYRFVPFNEIFSCFTRL